VSIDKDFAFPDGIFGHPPARAYPCRLKELPEFDVIGFKHFERKFYYHGPVSFPLTSFYSLTVKFQTGNTLLRGMAFSGTGPSVTFNKENSPYLINEPSEDILLLTG